MKSLYLISALLCWTAIWALATPADAGECKTAGKDCLFVDAAGCLIECPQGTCCKIKGAKCAYGFGQDAECSCFPCEPGGGGT